MFYLAWDSDIDTPFDPILHRQEAVEALSLTLEQREGEAPRASVEIVNPGAAWLLTLATPNALISWAPSADAEPVLVFRGSLTGAPSDLSGATATLEFLAQGPDTDANLRALAATLRTGDAWDPLFYADDAESDPAIALEARSALYHIDRRTLAVSASDYLTGSRLIDLGDGAFADSVSMSVGELPLSEVSLRVIAEWEQSARGSCNIAGRIRHAFGGRIASYTPDDLENSLSATGGVGGASGWSIERPTLQQSGRRVDNLGIRKFVSGYLGGGAGGGGGGSGDDSTGGGTPRPILDRYAYDIVGQDYSLTSYRLRYDYSQRRREVAEITVRGALQPVLGTRSRSEVLAEITLNDITLDTATPAWAASTAYAAGDRARVGARIWRCVHAHTSGSAFRSLQILDSPDGEPYRYSSTPGQFGMAYRTLWERERTDGSALGDRRRASYYDTDRGRHSLRHAIERARAHLRRRMRCLSVRFAAPWAGDLLDIDCDTSVRIESPRLPGGVVIGKVIGYTITAGGGTAPVVEVELGVSVGRGRADPLPSPGTTDYADEAWDAGEYQASVGGSAGTTQGVVWSVAAGPLRQPILASRLGDPGYVVRSLEVVGRPSEQRTRAHAAFLRPASQASDVQVAVQRSLSERPTRVSYALRDISPEDLLERAYAVSCEPLEGPRGINLDGEAAV